MKFMYEVCDTSDDEMYFPMGIFLDKESAIEAVKKLAADNPDCSITEHEPDEYERIEVRERKVGMPDSSTMVFTLERECKYDDETGEEHWITAYAGSI